MKPKHQRLIMVGVSVALLCAAALFTLKAFRENIVFFYTPSEVAGKTQQLIRLGGLVKEGSVVHGQGFTLFTVSDGQAELVVRTEAILPNLFREGQGVVAEGMLAEDGKQFLAKRVLAKHDENYMPREVADKLKASGHWHGQQP